MTSQSFWAWKMGGNVVQAKEDPRGQPGGTPAEMGVLRLRVEGTMPVSLFATEQFSAMVNAVLSGWDGNNYVACVEYP